MITDKPIVWLHGEVKTPPFSQKARIEAGFLLRKLQKGLALSLPHSRPMPEISKGCHELRIKDKDSEWRLVYRLDSDAVVIVDVFQKKQRTTPPGIIDTCIKRLKDYDT